MRQNRKNNYVCWVCGKVVEAKDAEDTMLFEHSTGIGLCKQCLSDLHYTIQAKEESKRWENSKAGKNKIELALASNKPHMMKEYLDKHIIGQERAKKILSVAVYNHYKRMKYAAEHKDEEIEKSNVIMLGPSGCGKTALISRLAKILDVPFAVTDASSLTEAGFVGADVEVTVRNLYYAAGQDIERTQRGIIYLDEFDKIARKSGANNSITADPGHEGVQQSLLKMLEGCDVEFVAQGKRRHPEAPTIKVNTSNIMFIVGGAFVGIEEIIAKRIQKEETSLGFGATVRGKEEKEKYNDLIHQVKATDLMEFGIIPEIIGRLPVICTLDALDENILSRILTEPIDSPIKQYQRLLSMDEAELEFENEALLAVAKKAIEQKTGARSLKGIIEDIMLDVMFDVPRYGNRCRVVVTKECITRGESPKIIPKTKETKGKPYKEEKIGA